MNGKKKLDFLGSFGIFLKSQNSSEEKKSYTKKRRNTKCVRKWTNLIDHYFHVGEEFPYDFDMRPSEYKVDDLCPLCDDDFITISIENLKVHKCRADHLSIQLRRFKIEGGRQNSHSGDSSKNPINVEPLIRLQKNSSTLAKLLKNDGLKAVDQIFLRSVKIKPIGFDTSQYSDQIEKLEDFVQKGGLKMLCTKRKVDKVWKQSHSKKRVIRKPKLTLTRFDEQKAGNTVDSLGSVSGSSFVAGVNNAGNGPITANTLHSFCPEQDTINSCTISEPTLNRENSLSYMRNSHSDGIAINVEKDDLILSSFSEPVNCLDEDFSGASGTVCSIPLPRQALSFSHASDSLAYANSSKDNPKLSTTKCAIDSQWKAVFAAIDLKRSESKEIKCNGIYRQDRSDQRKDDYLPKAGFSKPDKNDRSLAREVLTKSCFERVIDDVIKVCRPDTPSRNSESSDHSVENDTPPSEPESNLACPSVSLPCLEMEKVRKRLGEKVLSENAKRRKNSSKPTRRINRTLAEKSFENSIVSSQESEMKGSVSSLEVLPLSKIDSDETGSITNDSGIHFEMCHSSTSSLDCYEVLSDPTASNLKAADSATRRRDRKPRCELNNNHNWANPIVELLSSDDEEITTIEKPELKVSSFNN